MDASSLWDIMDTNLVPRDEIVLLTRYLVDSLRKNGFRRAADNFFREANIEEVGELDGKYMDYHELWRERGGAGMDLWTFFCHERLKQKRLEEETARMHLSPQPSMDQVAQVGQDNVIMSDAKRAELWKLCKYIFDYINSNRHLADIFFQKKRNQ